MGTRYGSPACAAASRDAPLARSLNERKWEKSARPVVVVVAE